MATLNDEMLDRVDMYFDALKERYVYYLETVFFPEQGGKRQPLFTSELDDREEFLFLQEAERKAAMVQQGTMQPDTATTLFMQNEDGAQERLAELRQKFGAM